MRDAKNSRNQKAEKPSTNKSGNENEEQIIARNPNRKRVEARNALRGLIANGRCTIKQNREASIEQ